MSPISQKTPGSTQQQNKPERSRKTSKAFFTAAADQLCWIFLQELQDVEDPAQQVASHSQLLVHLWARPFEQAALQQGRRILYNDSRAQLGLALDKLEERIEQTLRQEKTAPSQLQAAAKILVGLSTSTKHPLVFLSFWSALCHSTDTSGHPARSLFF